MTSRPLHALYRLYKDFIKPNPSSIVNMIPRGLSWCLCNTCPTLYITNTISHFHVKYSTYPKAWWNKLKVLCSEYYTLSWVLLENIFNTYVPLSGISVENIRRHYFTLSHTSIFVSWLPSQLLLQALVVYRLLFPASDCVLLRSWCISVPSPYLLLLSQWACVSPLEQHSTSLGSFRTGSEQTWKCKQSFNTDYCLNFFPHIIILSKQKFLDRFQHKKVMDRCTNCRKHPLIVFSW